MRRRCVFIRTQLTRRSRPWRATATLTQLGRGNTTSYSESRRCVSARTRLKLSPDSGRFPFAQPLVPGFWRRRPGAQGGGDGDSTSFVVEKETRDGADCAAASLEAAHACAGAGLRGAEWAVPPVLQTEATTGVSRRVCLPTASSNAFESTPRPSARCCSRAEFRVRQLLRATISSPTCTCSPSELRRVDDPHLLVPGSSTPTWPVEKDIFEARLRNTVVLFYFYGLGLRPVLMSRLKNFFFWLSFTSYELFKSGSVGTPRPLQLNSKLKNLKLKLQT